MNDEEIAFEMETAELALIEEFCVPATVAERIVALMVERGWSPSGIAQSVRIESLETELREVGKTFRALEGDFVERPVGLSKQMCTVLAEMCGEGADRCEEVANAGLPVRGGEPA